MAKPRPYKPKTNPTGRNDQRVGSEDRVLIIRRSLFHSPHVAALSTSGRALMFELQAMYNGTNNGTLFLSVRDAADRLGFTDLEAASNAFAELEAVGLITVTVEGNFAIKAGELSRARALRLNWIGDDGKTVSADKLEPLDFARLSAKQKRRIARRSAALDRYMRELRTNSAVRETRTLMADSVRETRTAAASIVRETQTLDAENRENSLGHDVRESLTHIEHHISGGFLTGSNGNNGPERPSGLIAAEQDPTVINSTKQAIHSLVSGFWSAANVNQRRSVAKQAGVTFDELQQFVGERIDLPLMKLITIRTIVKSMMRAAA